MACNNYKQQHAAGDPQCSSVMGGLDCFLFWIPKLFSCIIRSGQSKGVRGVVILHLSCASLRIVGLQISFPKAPSLIGQMGRRPHIVANSYLLRQIVLCNLHFSEHCKAWSASQAGAWESHFSESSLAGCTVFFCQRACVGFCTWSRGPLLRCRTLVMSVHHSLPKEYLSSY